MFREEIDDSYDAFMYVATNGMFSPRRPHRLNLGFPTARGVSVPAPKREKRNKAKAKMANASRRKNRK